LTNSPRPGAHQENSWGDCNRVGGHGPGDVTRRKKMRIVVDGAARAPIMPKTVSEASAVEGRLRVTRMQTHAMSGSSSGLHPSVWRLSRGAAGKGFAEKVRLVS
jgi:hypothetical protein